MENKARIIPTLKYQDAPKAIDWLCNTFGFEKHLVVSGENNTIAHAQLVYGNSMIMLGSRDEGEYGKLVDIPENFNGKNTQSPYIIVENIEEHYNKAVSSGAEILIELKTEDYGGQIYCCRDFEGHIWNFGSYNPWEPEK